MDKIQKKAKVNREVQKLVRYYKNQFPKEGELVVVQCITCQQNGCYVELLEYERKKGMIPLNEYTTSMKKHIHRAMKVGKVQVARVTKVDANKGYIDLSKSKVTLEDQHTGTDKFTQAKAVHSIIINISSDARQVNQIYNNIIWPLYQKYPTIHPHELIKSILLKQDKAEQLGFTDAALKADLINQLKRRYKKPIMKSISIFKVAIKSFDGIMKIKQILTAGVNASKQKDFDVKITILGAPDYLCEISTSTKEQGEQAIMLAINKIKEEAAKNGGEFQLKQKPKVVGDSNHAIHQIYAQEMDTKDQPDDEDQMGDEEEA